MNINLFPQHQPSQFAQSGVILNKFSERKHPSSFIMHKHQDCYYIFLLVEEGEGKGMVDFKEHKLKAGEMLFIQPGQMHHFIHSAEHTEGWILIIDSKYVGPEEKTTFDNYALNLSSFHLEENKRKEFTQIATLLKERLNMETNLHPSAVVALMTETLVAIIEEAVKNNVNKIGHKRCRQVDIVVTFRDLLAMHLQKEHSPSFYATCLNISTGYLNEIVKEVTGMSTALYIRSEIVLHAKRMLAHTELSVKQIGHKLGFDDCSYFTRTFTKMVGLTPTDFRARYLE